MNRTSPNIAADFLRKSAMLTNEDEVRELLPLVIRDIPVAMADLEAMRTTTNKGKIAWIEMILSACFFIAWEAHT